jgi:uncharacterized membrane protein YcaP (DUF421 family)
VMAALRIQGVRDMREVKFAVVEHDGTVSVVHYDWAQPASKADIDKDMAKARKDAIGDQEEPPPSKRSDSAKALDRQPEEIR